MKPYAIFAVSESKVCLQVGYRIRKPSMKWMKVSMNEWMNECIYELPRIWRSESTTAGTIRLKYYNIDITNTSRSIQLHLHNCRNKHIGRTETQAQTINHMHINKYKKTVFVSMSIYKYISIYPFMHSSIHPSDTPLVFFGILYSISVDIRINIYTFLFVFYRADILIHLLSIAG